MALTKVQSGLISGVPTSALPAGCVLQVVQAITNTQTSNSTGTYATALSASITPSSSSSKILVLVSAVVSTNPGNNTGAGQQLTRGATTLITNPYVIYDSNNGGGQRINMESIIYLDSPATTSSTTYNYQIASSAPGTTVYVSQYGQTTITLMEIAG